MLGFSLISGQDLSKRIKIETKIELIFFSMADFFSFFNDRNRVLTVYFEWIEYRLISKKGEGTFSEVLQAQEIKSNKQVAIKCMKANFYNIEKVSSICSHYL